MHWRTSTEHLLAVNDSAQVFLADEMSTHISKIIDQQLRYLYSSYQMMTLLTWLSRLQSWLHKPHELCLSTLRCTACRHQTPMLMPVTTCPSNLLATLRHAHSSTWPRMRSSKTCHDCVWSVVFLVLHQMSTSIRAVHRITRNNKSWYFL